MPKLCKTFFNIHISGNTHASDHQNTLTAGLFLVLTFFLSSALCWQNVELSSSVCLVRAHEVYKMAAECERFEGA